MTKPSPATFAGFYCLLATSGCISLVDSIPQTIDPALANSPYYPAGYSDGCNTAVEAAKNFSTELIRNESLFESERGYSYGWRQGYADCNKTDALNQDGGLRGERDLFE